MKFCILKTALLRAIQIFKKPFPSAIFPQEKYFSRMVFLVEKMTD
jgi:hypothetical protein